MASSQVVEEGLARDLVLEYFVVKGNKRAAVTFAHESGATTDCSLEHIDSRVRLHELISSGHIQDAIRALEGIGDGSILTGNRHLHFALCIQQFIEILRVGSSSEALAFARVELKHFGDLDTEFAETIQECLPLLIFAASGNYPDSLMKYFDLERRENLISEVNKAILTKFAHGAESRLHQIVRILDKKQTEIGGKLPGFTPLDGLSDD